MSYFQRDHSATTLPPWLCLKYFSGLFPMTKTWQKLLCMFLIACFICTDLLEVVFVARWPSLVTAKAEKIVEISPDTWTQQFHISPVLSDPLITKYCRNLEMQDLVWKNPSLHRLFSSSMPLDYIIQSASCSHPAPLWSQWSFLSFLLPLGRFCLKFLSSHFIYFSPEFMTNCVFIFLCYFQTTSA